MYPELPLQQLCCHSAQSPQLAFARNAIELLNERPDRRFQATEQGLMMLGETEEALSYPLEILRSAYGDRLRVGALTIRYRRDPVAMEPHMGLRITCSVACRDEVCSDLAARRSSISSAEVERSQCVIRASAPLAEVLGYTNFLGGLTNGQGKVVMWYSHYAPLPPSRERSYG